MIKVFKLTKNKSLEIVFIKPKHFRSYFDICLSWTRKTDHAGLNFYLQLTNLFSCECNITDNRHWNADQNRWYYDGEWIPSSTEMKY